MKCCRFTWLGWFSITALMIGPAHAQIQRLELVLPTDNRALLDGDGPGYYQFVDRTFEGQKSTPWEGGKFGFTRNPARVGAHLVHTRFHEGLDIKPARRDAKGEPLDDVRAISAGEVVHVSKISSQSNYGRYIVVRHDWGYGPFYSLYAHLNGTSVERGSTVNAGDKLGLLGYTGAGIDKRRAHLHLELALMWSTRFQDWYDGQFATPNHHGIYNGQNLMGMDVAALFLAHAKDPTLSAAQFVLQTPAYFEVAIPGSATMEIVRSHAWLCSTELPKGPPPSWRISFTAWGLPVAVQPAQQTVAVPQVVAVRDSPISHSYHTRGLINGSGKQAQLTSAGLNFLRLACGLR